MRISQKIAATGLVPLFAVLVLLSFGAVDRLRQRGSLLQLQSNLAAFETLSTTIDSLQTERGRTAMYLAGGCPREDLSTARKAADETLPPLSRAVAAAELSEKDRQAALSLAQKLEAMRAPYGVTNASLRAHAIEAYTALIGELREIELTLVHTKGSVAYAKPLTSMTLLELAKERNGQLRARGSSLLALNRPLSEEDSTLILRLMSDVVGTLTSPAMILGDSQREQLAQLQDSASWREGQRIVQVLLTKASKGDYGIPGTEFFKVSSANIEGLRGICRSQMLALTGQLQGEIKVFNRALAMGFATATILIFAMAWVTFAVARGMVKRIGALVDLLREIAEGGGDLTVRLPVEGRDELAALAGHFNTFISRLQSMTSEIREAALGLSTSSTDMSAVAARLSESVDRTSTRITSVAAAAEESSSNTVSVAASMEQASTNLSTVASATEQLHATTTEIASSTEKARAMSGQAADQATSMNALMQQLGEAAREIDQVTATINTISAQTHLLALNATIEAARAGTAGRGFAVVANEIKELARQTAEATGGIKERVAGVQSSTRSAVTNIERITTVIQEMGQLVNQIAAAVDQQASTTKGVAGNISQASLGVADANQRVAQTSSVSTEIARDVAAVGTSVSEIRHGGTQVNENATRVAKLAEHLGSLVSRFKVEANAQN